MGTGLAAGFLGGMSSDGAKLAGVFVVVTAVVCFAGVVLYYDPHITAPSSTEGLLQDQPHFGEAVSVRSSPFGEARTSQLAQQSRPYGGSMVYKTFYDSDVPCGPGPLPDTNLKLNSQSSCRQLCSATPVCLGFLIPPDGKKCIFRGTDEVNRCSDIWTTNPAGHKTSCGSKDGCYKKAHTWYRKVSLHSVVSQKGRSKHLKSRRNVRGGGLEWPEKEPVGPPPPKHWKKVPWEAIKWPGGPRKHVLDR